MFFVKKNIIIFAILIEILLIIPFFSNVNAATINQSEQKIEKNSEKIEKETKEEVKNTKEKVSRESKSYFIKLYKKACNFFNAKTHREKILIFFILLLLIIDIIIIIIQAIRGTL